jgi:hypothetical protein
MNSHLENTSAEPASLAAKLQGCGWSVPFAIVNGADEGDAAVVDVFDHLGPVMFVSMQVAQLRWHEGI